MKQIAIIGPTASGKTSLAIETAIKTDSIILSLDSLSVYKEIDIASAKPSLKERKNIFHFGIDEVFPNEKFDVTIFFECYKNAKNYALENQKNLIIVGGSGFYLKSLIDGISPNVNPSEDDKLWVSNQLLDLPNAYSLLQQIDADYAKKIYSTDSYRIEKALCIYKSSGLSPNEFFIKHPKISLIENIDIFEILWDSDFLRQRIKLRTQQMLKDGLIDEVTALVKKFGIDCQPFKSIGIKETIEFLDNKISYNNLEELIAIHTSQLAKKQRTFNRGQFLNKYSDALEGIKKEILKHF